MRRVRTAWSDMELGVGENTVSNASTHSIVGFNASRSEVAAVEDWRLGELTGILGLVPPWDRAIVAALGAEQSFMNVDEVSVPWQELTDAVDNASLDLMKSSKILPTGGSTSDTLGWSVHETLDSLGVTHLVAVRHVTPFNAGRGVGATSSRSRSA